MDGSQSSVAKCPMKVGVGHVAVPGESEFEQPILGPLVPHRFQPWPCHGQERDSRNPSWEMVIKLYYLSGIPILNLQDRSPVVSYHVT